MRYLRCAAFGLAITFLGGCASGPSNGAQPDLGQASVESAVAPAATATAPATPPPAPREDQREDQIEALDAELVAPEDVPDPDAELDVSERNIFAGVNIAIAEVDLADIIFDTFDGGSVSMAEASEAQVNRLLNAIPPIDDPMYMPTADASWLTADDIVLGFIGRDGSAWAHPHRILNLHEIVNTTIAGDPVAITYCPLCGSGLVFHRLPNDLRHDGVLTFDNTSALYENDMVMVDAETNTYWWQVGGRGIVGNLTGTELTLLPSRTTSWAQWTELYPDSMVLSNDQGRGARYEVDIFEGYAARLDAGGRTPFPTSDGAFADDRLQPATRVIGFEIGDEPGAVAVLANEPTVVPIGSGAASAVVFLDGQGGGQLFRAIVDGQAATFEVRDGSFVDSVLGSSWDSAGRAVSGPAVGDQLDRLPSRTAYWFAWVSTLDGATSQLFTPAS